MGQKWGLWKGICLAGLSPCWGAWGCPELSWLPWCLGDSRAAVFRVKARKDRAAWGLGHGTVRSRKTEKASRPHRWLSYWPALPFWEGSSLQEQAAFFVALTCRDLTFVTLSGLVVSSYQLSINRQNTHFNSEYGEAHLFADRSWPCKLTKCRVPCLLIIILKICAATNWMIYTSHDPLLGPSVNTRRLIEIKGKWKDCVLLRRKWRHRTVGKRTKSSISLN